MKELTLRIAESGRIQVESVSEGIHRYKEIAPDALLKCVHKSVLRQGVSSGILPKGCISYTEFDNGDKYVCILHQENFSNISYYRSSYIKFPLPKLVFGFYITSENRISSCRLGVIENTQLIKPETRMYEYPFSNVNSNFSLCLGNNQLPRCSNLFTLTSMPYMILEMPNNNDYFVISNNQRNLEMRDLLEELKDKDTDYYYSDVLIKKNKTLQDFIKCER